MIGAAFGKSILSLGFSDLGVPLPTTACDDFATVLKSGFISSPLADFKASCWNYCWPDFFFVFFLRFTWAVKTAVRSIKLFMLVQSEQNYRSHRCENGRFYWRKNSFRRGNTVHIIIGKWKLLLLPRPEQNIDLIFNIVKWYENKI